MFLRDMLLKVNSLNRAVIAIHLTDKANILLIIRLQLRRLSELPKGIRNETKEDVGEYHNDHQMEKNLIYENFHKEPIVVLEARRSKQVSDSSSASDSVVDEEEQTLNGRRAERLSRNWVVVAVYGFNGEKLIEE